MKSSQFGIKGNRKISIFDYNQLLLDDNIPEILFLIAPYKVNMILLITSYDNFIRMWISCK